MDVIITGTAEGGGFTLVNGELKVYSRDQQLMLHIVGLEMPAETYALFKAGLRRPITINLLPLGSQNSEAGARLSSVQKLAVIT